MDGSSRNALDRVISSYISSFKSLTYARQRARKVAQSGSQKALLVSMSKTRDQMDLRHVKDEVQALNTILSQSAQVYTTVLESPKKAEVISQLPASQILHLACHGQCASRDPFASSLLLDDWQSDPLRVRDISALKFQHVEFAYLSACHAANSRMNEGLIDERIHLAQACQLTGFPHVVGTLWQVDDAYSATFAAKVYGFMLESTGRINAEKSAEGVHRAMRQLRDTSSQTQVLNKNDPLLWAAYIHVGG